MTFLGLGFLILVIINLFFFIYQVLGFRKWVLLSAIALTVNFTNVKAYLGNFSNVESTEQVNLTVATLNTQLFGYFDKDKKSKPDWEKDVVQIIKKRNPDILCFQEFLSLGAYDLDFFKKKLDFKYAHFKVLKDGRKKGTFGIVIFSKYPILDIGGLEFSQYTGNMGAWIDVQINDKKIRVMNVHLQSIRFSRADYKLIENPKEKLNIEESKTLLKRVRDASCTRAQQVDVLMEQIKTSPYPMVLCGDFNEPPVSYGYGQVSHVLNDVYTQTQLGLETTYTGKFPAYRIDYIFTHSSIKAIDYSSKIVPSDHKLVIAKLKL